MTVRYSLLFPSLASVNGSVITLERWAETRLDHRL